MMEWMPIETAPKDGTDVVLVKVGNKPWIGRFYTHLQERYGMGWRNSHGNLFNPTHWMPLPEPPVIKENPPTTA